MMLLERKDDMQFKGDVTLPLPLDLKQVTEDGEFEGYAATFGNVDRGADICVAGCFADTLVRFPPPKVKMLFQHRTDMIIGKWLELREDPKGLYAKGKLFNSVEKGRETLALMREGALDGLSIGFKSLVDEYDRTLGVRRLIKVELREISVVTFPMNDQATVSGVKNHEFNPREMERAFREEMHLSSGDAVTAVALVKKHLRRDAEDHSSAAARDETGAMNGLLEALRGVREGLHS